MTPNSQERGHAHTPKAHAKHTTECGCGVGAIGEAMCRYCGASYVLADVLEFPAWRCYDCGAGANHLRGWAVPVTAARAAIAPATGETK